MQTQCRTAKFAFARVEGRPVVASFDGGAITSDAGAVLLKAADRAIGLLDRFAGCFVDRRRGDLIEHDVRTLVSQRVFGIALGYEDLNDHDHLRHDPIMAVLAGKLEARRRDCAPVAGRMGLGLRPTIGRRGVSGFGKPGHQQPREPHRSDQAARNGPISHASAIPRSKQTRPDRQSTHQTSETGRRAIYPG